MNFLSPRALSRPAREKAFSGRVIHIVGDSAERTLWEEASVADSAQAERNLAECCPKHDGR